MVKSVAFDSDGTIASQLKEPAAASFPWNNADWILFRHILLTVQAQRKRIIS